MYSLVGHDEEEEEDDDIMMSNNDGRVGATAQVWFSWQLGSLSAKSV